MPMLMELKQNHKAALDKAESIVAASERETRNMTANEQQDYDSAMTQIQALAPQIETIQRQNTLHALVARQGVGVLLPGTHAGEGNTPVTGKPGKTKGRVLSAEYMDNFYAYVASNGLNSKAEAALYEGSNPAGGFAVPVEVDGQIVQLAPAETGVRSIAQVLTTTHDIRVPRKASNGAVQGKAESGATVNTFYNTSASLDQFLLSAYMAGASEDISFELAQDVPVMQSFVVSDLLNAQQQYEEGKYVNGSGNGEAQGLIGNVGAGVTEEPDANGNLVTIDGTLDLIGALNSVYQEGASFLMSRLTSIIVRKAQRQANLFEPVWTRSGGQDYLHGYPVAYSSQMPSAARGASPLLFGDFKQGYLIGDRGGSGVNVKVLDQPKALQGLITLLAYRRTDGRVRRSEAIQSYNIAAS